MLKLVLLFTFGCMTNLAFALDCQTERCFTAQAVIDVLESDLTPQQAKDLLIEVMNGPTVKSNTAILSNEIQDSALGTSVRSIKVGVDVLDDDDSGWSVVYEILVKTVAGKITEVTLVSYAG